MNPTNAGMNAGVNTLTNAGVPNMPRRNVTVQAKSLTAHCHCQQNRKYDGALYFNFHSVFALSYVR